MKKKYIIFSLLIIISLVSFSQMNENDSSRKNASAPKPRNMFGIGIPRGLTKTSDGLADGYVLFAATNSPFMYLINRKGEVVHQWKSNYGVFQGYLQDDGSLIQAANDPDFPVFGCCGPYGRIQKINWDGKIVWDFEYANEQHIAHHDFAVMPNGHILAIAYEAMPYDKAMALGRKPELTPKSGPWTEEIVEIVPEGKTGGRIVWEWHLSDHLIQDVDPKKAGYGKIADHPELLDFNLGFPVPPSMSQDALDELIAKGMAHPNATVDNGGSDIFHFNAIKYNADLDQIVFSSPNISEIYIIDHSTTTQEAAGHKGGRLGKGGDFVYRWGNPQNYKRGDESNRQLFGQHDIRWIPKGYPGAGNLTLFNNHLPGEIDWSSMGTIGNNYSMIYELTPPADKKGNYIIEKGKAYGPEQPAWFYRAQDTLSFYSSFISGAHRMENGNTFINEGAKGRFFEVTPDGKIVWEYLNPYHGNIRQPNGDPNPVMPMPFETFRANFIPANHPALANKKLDPITPQPAPFIMPQQPSGN